MKDVADQNCWTTGDQDLVANLSGDKNRFERPSLARFRWLHRESTVPTQDP